MTAIFILFMFFTSGKCQTGIVKTMYEDAASYSSSSSDHQREVKWCLENFASHLKWKKNERVLDIGCGSGDSTRNVLLPYINQNINFLVGVDMNPKMIKFASEKWKNVPKLSFTLLDISEDNPENHFSEGSETFDKIFSFFTLQWVKDRSAMSKNINKLLKPGGQALFLIVAKSGIYYVWDTIAKSPKWNTYLKGIRQPINDYAYTDKPLNLFMEHMMKFDMQLIHAKVIERKNIFRVTKSTDEELIARLRTVDPFIQLIPEERKEAYLRDLLELTKRMVSPTGANDYTAMIVVLGKP